MLRNRLWRALALWLVAGLCRNGESVDAGDRELEV